VFGLVAGLVLGGVPVGAFGKTFDAESHDHALMCHPPGSETTAFIREAETVSELVGAHRRIRRWQRQAKIYRRCLDENYGQNPLAREAFNDTVVFEQELAKLFNRRLSALKSKGNAEG
jgi:hypothetical protein